MARETAHQGQRPIAVFALGLSLSAFLTITLALCVAFDLLFPQSVMHEAWSPFLPGFVWISWRAFGIGIVETFTFGWYAALIYGPLYNMLAVRS